jgi:uncharacterized protein (TIGR03083 family)
MSDLTREELDELLGAWALDALDDDARVAVEAALARHPDLAATARELRESAAGLAELSAVEGEAVASVLAAATTARVPGMDARIAEEGPSTSAEAYADQVGALARVLERVPDDGWDRVVAPYAPWTVRDLVAHLVAIEGYAASFLGLGAFEEPEGGTGDHLAMTEPTIAHYRTRPVEEVGGDWTRLAERSAAHVLTLSDEDLERPMHLHGIPFRTPSALVARTFELWTHADDIRAAVGEPLDAPPARVVHRMADASINSLPLAAYTLDTPPGPAVAHVVLTGRGGGAWTLLVGGAEDRAAEPDLVLVADVIDYCRVVSRRVNAEALDAVVEGDAELALQLLEASQFVAV